MSEYPLALEELIEQFRKLPSIGKKTAQRLAIAVLSMSEDSVHDFSSALKTVKEKIHPCPICGNWTDKDICDICASPLRDQTTLCVVEDASILMAMERGGSYRGLYHVLGGTISPMQDRGPEALGVDTLLARLPRKGEHSSSLIKEVILAISSTVEGETTLLFLAELLKHYNVRVTRIASGIPVGGSLDYYDDITVARAMEERRTLLQ